MANEIGASTESFEGISDLLPKNNLNKSFNGITDLKLKAVTNQQAKPVAATTSQKQASSQKTNNK